MTIDHSALTKGQVRKLNALRKSIGDDIAEDAFSKWMKTQTKTPKEVRDPVADALVAHWISSRMTRPSVWAPRDMW
jgi:Fe-S cluster biosynthesis and repair protein YggX